MKTLFRAILTLVLAFSARAEISGQTVNGLLRAIRAELPKGWSASYDEEHSWLEVTRDEKVFSVSALPNGPPDEKPERRSFTLAFRVSPIVSTAEFRRLSAENAKIQKEATTLYEDLIRRRVSHKFDSFLPNNEEDRNAVSRYEALKESLHSLPDFYFRDISLSWQIGSPEMPSLRITDERVRDQCTRIQQKVVKLLSKYEGA